jgi:hypothetical protein
VLLSRRIATALAMLAALGRAPASRADTPAASVKPGTSKPAEPPKPVVEPVDKNQAVAILGRPVTGPGKQQIGRLIDVLVDGTGQPQAAVIDVGGFMGLGTRTIAVHWKALHFAPWDPANPISLDLSLDQIKAAPEYKGMSTPAPVVAPAPKTPVAAH